MSTFQLEIVTPDRHFFSGQVQRVIVRGVEGDLAVLKGRAPFITPISIGRVQILDTEGKEKYGALVDGYVSVLPDKTVIITDAAEWAEEIDIERAEAALRIANDRINKNSEEIDVERAKAAITRALNRIDVYKEKDSK